MLPHVIPTCEKCGTRMPTFRTEKQHTEEVCQTTVAKRYILELAEAGLTNNFINEFRTRLKGLPFDKMEAMGFRIHNHPVTGEPEWIGPRMWNEYWMAVWHEALAVINLEWDNKSRLHHIRAQKRDPVGYSRLCRLAWVRFAATMNRCKQRGVPFIDEAQRTLGIVNLQETEL
jgi:hypothetical protein